MSVVPTFHICVLSPSWFLLHKITEGLWRQLEPVQGDPRPSSSLLRWTFSAFLLEQCLYSSPTMSCQSPLGHSHEKTTATSVGGKAAHGAQHPPQWRGRETPSFPHSLPCAETLESQLPWHVTEPLPLREHGRRVTLIISEADV